MARLDPRLDGFDPALARRIALTVSGTDTDDIAKVEDAGSVRDQDGHSVQVMHNGLLVEEGGYFGSWMAEIIRTLRGHHEPQEERIFDQVVRRLQSTSDAPVMIEFGSYWTYYGLWFCQALPGSHVVAIEPDPQYMEVGRRNAALNGLSDRVTFVAGAVGAEPGTRVAFRAESDGGLHGVRTYDLASLMAETGVAHVDLVLSDIQGAESILLERARGDLEAGRVRFLMVSTHHHSISGDHLTHQFALDLLLAAGAHVIAEHTVGESFSGDGLIAVSFDPRDKDMTIEISHARAKDSLFGELEYDLAAMSAGLERAEQASAQNAEAARAELARVSAERDQLRAQLAAITSTRVWRWSGRPRAAYAHLRRR